MAGTGAFAVLKRIVIFLVVLYAAGFVVFVTSLPRTPHDLRHIQGHRRADRRRHALDAPSRCSKRASANDLLISGVNPQTSKEDLKKRVQGGARFDCCADLGYAAEDTHGNAQRSGQTGRDSTATAES